MEYYPLFLHITARPCLVVGGGVVAERKVDGLLAAEAAVTVISPTLTERLQEWRDRGSIRHLARDYHDGDVIGFQLAFVTTDDRMVNERVALDGQQHGVLVNAADDVKHCDFILPAVIRRGTLTVAVASGGTAPALTRAIRDELEEYFTEDYAALSQIVAAVRGELRQQGRSCSSETWSVALKNLAFRHLVAEGRFGEAKAYLARHLVGANS